ncbi:MAG TPA: anti-sigma factor [Xanthobacteraceae bacterium]|jgi:anti-sigma-K factor RskA|nr:anti-sigma factor [Xanthobacteraceae bacterium]
MIENPDKEVLAAEYVLGTLGFAERVQAQQMIASDPAFAALVRDWERRLGELNVLVTPVEPPPAILDWIKARHAGGDPIRDVLAEEPLSAAGEAAPTIVPPPVEPALMAPAAAVPPAVESPSIEPSPGPTPRPQPVPPPPEREPASTAQIIALTRRARRWRGTALAIAALAAAFAVVVVVREVEPELMPDPLKPRVVERQVEVVKTVEVPSPRPAQYVAVLQRDATSPAFLLTFDLDKRTLTVRTVGAERQPGKAYELWLVSDRFKSPRSLGLIGNEEFTQRPQLANYDAVTINRATYAVSLEPEGGSPTGAPTGPVLFSGRLLQATPPTFAAPSP